MKKSSVALAVVAALAIAYPAASWVTGKRLETKLTQSDKKDVLFSNFKIVKQTYTRGIFSSKQESTIEFDVASMSPAAAPMSLQDQSEQGEQDAADPQAALDEQQVMPAPKLIKPLQFQVVNYIQHGPVPAIFGVAAGKIETEFVLDATTKEEIKRIFGDKKFLEIRTILNYGGGGKLQISSPAVNTTVGMNQDKLDWKGVNLEVAFDAAYKKLKFDLYSAGLDVLAAKGATSVKVGETKMQGDAERIYPDGFIYLGTSKASIASMSFSNAQAANKGFSIKDISLESTTSAKNDLLDSGLKFGIANITMNDTQIGNFHYDYSLQRLHGPSVNKLFIELSTIDQYKNDPQKMLEMQKQWKEYGIEILKHNPVISLDRLSLAGKNGEFKASAKFQFNGVQAQDFDNPMLLLSKIESAGEVSLADAMIDDLIDGSQTDPDARAMMRSQYYSQIDAWEKEGFLKREGKVLNSKISWKNGQLMVNGKAFPPKPAVDPAALGAEAAPMEMR
ncbi:YdgA family protein [Undibacterium macrobrachii]|uniref:DUF945 domain-containing protein n=1 Tax=Undibacterium macrobrachii TaxID=1119058 RepID=A0ABQ2XAT4_9BURK|nr:YdgA family protein [Undibacterium macrobrachii]GGX07840.1 hypothetical protein GCM10011282_12120 [Undibacterium macrobrachii]